ncbi:hypothetical protein G6F68_010414 [Rhizopus microsporus]|nr:hypothetical protein G6F68_010414 [Rhizopus microsporus]
MLSWVLKLPSASTTSGCVLSTASPRSRLTFWPGTKPRPTTSAVLPGTTFSPRETTWPLKVALAGWSNTGCAVAVTASSMPAAREVRRKDGRNDMEGSLHT